MEKLSKKWTQERVAAWALETFGPAGSNASCAARANKEMSELLSKLAHDDNHPGAGEEAADIVICLFRLASRLGVDLMGAIDAKMDINVDRVWAIGPDGQAQHVER